MCDHLDWIADEFERLSKKQDDFVYHMYEWIQQVPLSSQERLVLETSLIYLLEGGFGTVYLPAVSEMYLLQHFVDYFHRERRKLQKN